MNFADWYVNRPKVGDGEKNSGEIITTTLGYISPKRQIEAILCAGERTRLARESEYIYPSGSPVDDDGYTVPFIYADKLDIAEHELNLKESINARIERSVDESIVTSEESSEVVEEKNNAAESV